MDTLECEGVKKLSLCTPALLSDLHVPSVLPYMLQRGLITMEEDTDIRKEQTSQNMAIKVIHLVSSQGQAGYDIFREVLCLDHEHLVTMLDNCSLDEDPEEAEDELDASPVHIAQFEAMLPQVLTVERVVKSLLGFYQQHLTMMTPLPWCDWLTLDLAELYTNLQMVRKKRNKYTTNLEDLFASNMEFRSAKKILVEGEPGIGKSTLTHKLTYDWTTGVKDPSHYLYKFKMVFTLRVNEIKSSLAESICDQLLPEDMNVRVEDLENLLREHQDEILFILDGYDEVHNGKEIILKLLQGKILQHATVLMTSRPYHAISMLKYFGNYFIIKGYSTKKKKVPTATLR